MEELRIGKYKIDPVLFHKGFAKGCGPFQCETTCCHSGVFIDPKERDVVLQHQDQVKSQMDESQTTDESRWFEGRIEVDNDFPSGYAVGTEVFNEKCVFMRKDGRCSIQLASGEVYNDPWKIKPFYCIAFPIVVMDGLLTFDDYQHGATRCCSISGDKETTLVESCKAELEFILGSEGYRTLVEMKNTFSQTEDRS